MEGKSIPDGDPYLIVSGISDFLYNVHSPWADERGVQALDMVRGHEDQAVLTAKKQRHIIVDDSHQLN